MYQYKKKGERETRVLLLLLQVETDGQIGLALSRGGGQICHTGEPVVMMKKGGITQPLSQHFLSLLLQNTS